MNRTTLRLGILAYAVLATAATGALYLQSYPRTFEVDLGEGDLVCSNWEVIEAYQVPNGVRLGAIMHCTRYERENDDERTETPGPSGTEA